MLPILCIHLHSSHGTCQRMNQTSKTAEVSANSAILNHAYQHQPWNWFVVNWHHHSLHRTLDWYYSKEEHECKSLSDIIIRLSRTLCFSTYRSNNSDIVNRAWRARSRTRRIFILGYLANRGHPNLTRVIIQCCHLLMWGLHTWKPNRRTSSRIKNATFGSWLGYTNI